MIGKRNKNRKRLESILKEAKSRIRKLLIDKYVKEALDKDKDKESDEK
tara:strand:+ start:746 stop:889 length:144 start_codon:yes stop_codon:yes gene_type:complete